MPIDYQNGKIYKIYSLSKPDLVYIGSTTQTLSQRMAEHRTRYKHWKKTGKRYTTSFTIFEETDNYRIELIKLCPCNSKMELHRTEGKYILEMNCINKRVAGRTDKQYYEQNKDKISQRHKQYRKANKETINQKAKQYYESNKEAISQRGKQYREANRDKIQQRHKQYREANRDKIQQRRSIKITCECGSVVRKNDIARHRQTNKHKRLIKQ